MKRKPLAVLIGALALGFVAPPQVQAGAKYANDIYYLCADWGPDLDTKDPEKADEIIYFIKLIKFFSPWGSEKGPSERLWFCKMNWDGSHKQEICELWAGQKSFVEPEPHTMWLSVAPKAKKAAFSIEYGNSPSLGLFIIDLDGKIFHPLAQPIWTDTDQRTYIHPGISPDGEEVVFAAKQHAQHVHPRGQSKLGVVKVNTGEVCWLTDGPCDQQPDWSPDGKWIVFTHSKEFTSNKDVRRIWLIRPDGSENKPVMGLLNSISRTIDPEKELFAWWPAWSTDSHWIYALSGNPCFDIINGLEGKTVLYIDSKKYAPSAQVGAAKLGRKGILCTGLATWLLCSEAPNFKVTNVIYIGPHASVPSEHYGSVSTYDLKWGERQK